MGILEKIYDNSPIFLQNIMVTVSGYLKNAKRYGKTYYEYRKFLEEFDQWPLEKKLDYQRKELISLIKYAYENSEFYRELYKNININDIQSVEDLKKLPIVGKEMLRKNISKVITIPRKEGVKAQTGGTTGKSLEVIFRKEDMMKRMAMLDHFKARVGFEHRKMKRATFNGKHIIPPSQTKKVFWRYNNSCKQMIYSSFHLTDENLKYYVDSLNKFKPHALDGFFSSMCDIASYIERHNIKLKFTPIAVFPTSETLTRTGRELLERVFNCKVYDQYASSEGASFVTECKNQKLHMELASGVFEHYDNNNEVLVTSFTTYGTPLIRYKIGDSMIFENENESCSCNINAPIIKEIQGRSLDFLYAADGSKIRHVGGVFRKLPNVIIRTQFIQDKIGEITVKLQVDKKKYKKEYDDILINEFIHRFGKDTKIVLKHVDEIPREKSGKYRMIKNNVKI